MAGFCLIKEWRNKVSFSSRAAAFCLVFSCACTSLRNTHDVVWRGCGGIFYPCLSVVPFFFSLSSSTKHRAIDLQALLHMEGPIKVKTLQSRLQNAHFVLHNCAAWTICELMLRHCHLFCQRWANVMLWKGRGTWRGDLIITAAHFCSISGALVGTVTSSRMMSCIFASCPQYLEKCLLACSKLNHVSLITWDHQGELPLASVSHPGTPCRFFSHQDI